MSWRVPPHRGSAQPTCQSYPFVRQFGPELGEPVSPAPPSAFASSFARFPFSTGAAVSTLNRAAGGGREYLLQGSKSCAALAEAFDHADVSLVNLLNSDGDAAPIGADVEVIERVNVLLRLRTTRNVWSQFFAIV